LMAMINVLGGKVRSVHSNCLNAAKVYDRQFDDTSTTLLKFENGALGVLVQSLAAPAPPTVPLISIFGTRGSIVERVAFRGKDENAMS